jgi:hypothetical protein
MLGAQSAPGGSILGHPAATQPIRNDRDML